MINSIFSTYPSKYYSNSIDSIVNDTLKFVDLCSAEKSFYNYKIREEEGNYIFKCLVPGLDEKHLNISITNQNLEVKTSDDIEDIEFSISLNKKIKLPKEIDCNESFANLEKGILTITMPISERKETKKIKFK